MTQLYVDIITRWVHVLFGITWIGLLFYFNFVQGEYFKEASKDALGDIKVKLATRALWWFRWAAIFTFLTGVVLAGLIGPDAPGFIIVGALLGTFMMLNVWLIIWPHQKVVLGLKEGNVPTSAAKSGLASRTNTLFSVPLLMGMLASKHGAAFAAGMAPVSMGYSNGLLIALGLVVLLELNAIFGKMGPMASVKGVIHMSIILTVVMVALLVYI